MKWWLLPMGCWLLLAAAPARAEETGQAHGLFREGRELYRQGRYDEAVKAYQRGYSLSGRPGFLFNIGLVYRKMRNCRAALDHYGRYLEQEPGSRERGRVERHMGEMRRCLEREPPRARASVSRPTEGPPGDLASGAHRAERRRGWGPWLTGGVGLAVGTAGAVLLISVDHEFDRLEAECAPLCAPESWSSYRVSERIGWGLLAAGSVALAAGVVWWLVDRRGSRRPEATALRVEF